MNPQKYPQIIDLYAWTLNMLALMFLFLINYLTSSGTCSIPKLLKKTISFFLQNKAIQCTKMHQNLHIHQGLLRMPHTLFFMQIILE